MKRLLIAYLVLLGVSVALADRFPPGALVSSKRAEAGGGGSCNTLAESFDGSNIGETYIGFTGDYTYAATFFDCTGKATICSGKARLKRVGSPTMLVQMEIWSYDTMNNRPNTLISSSGTVDSSTISTSYSLVSFSSISASVSSGTRYCVVVRKVSGSSDTSNYLLWEDGQITDPGHDTIWSGTAVPVWTPSDIANINQLEFELYK